MSWVLASTEPRYRPRLTVELDHSAVWRDPRHSLIMTLKLNGTNSEAAPAYAGDDADTGLQCGTNELKLVTGGSARATVDSSGNFGIGTAQLPQAILRLKCIFFRVWHKLAGQGNWVTDWS